MGSPLRWSLDCCYREGLVLLYTCVVGIKRGNLNKLLLHTFMRTHCTCGPKHGEHVIGYPAEDRSLLGWCDHFVQHPTAWPFPCRASSEDEGLLHVPEARDAASLPARDFFIGHMSYID
jgi:hypothetical protein